MRRPLLVLLMGLPGAGKSTLARRLAAAHRLSVVDRDRLRAERFRRLGYGSADKARLERAVARQVRTALRRGSGVVVDGMSFASAAQRRRFALLAAAAGARCHMVLVDCPPEVAAARVAAQAWHPAADRDPALVRAVAARFAPVGRGVRRCPGTRPMGMKLLSALGLPRR